jgi:membrane protein YqaA with SNARE-associated domain
VGTGFASALIPLVNAEAAVTAGALTLPTSAAITVATAIAVGQTAGKVLLFEGARRGVRRWAKSERRRSLPAWQQRVLDERPRGRWQADGIVLLAAVVGIPPLAVVSLAAGAIQSRLADFVVCCLAGRTVRFVVIAVALLSATSG